jgi:hypothetical protein
MPASQVFFFLPSQPTGQSFIQRQICSVPGYLQGIARSEFMSMNTSFGRDEEKGCKIGNDCDTKGVRRTTNAGETPIRTGLSPNSALQRRLRFASFGEFSEKVASTSGM